MTKNNVDMLLRKIKRAADKEDLEQVTKTYEELRFLLEDSLEDMSEQHRTIAMLMLRALDKEIAEVCNNIRLHEIIYELESDIVDHDLSLANSVLDRYRLGNV
jgi:Fe2+ transport system protein B